LLNFLLLISKALNEIKRNGDTFPQKSWKRKQKGGLCQFNYEQLLKLKLMLEAIGRKKAKFS
jgi:hypothetical protein